ncbi:BREX-2 system adenine-specific DNA-methyltransferase PglX [Kocuria sp. CH-021]|uniref:BREX-2 system adenine-specific DNA-methyltransferase PglX n=1 Tax=Kocuria sp. CH-021 TaxID=3406735 RepID=UPI003C71D6BC
MIDSSALLAALKTQLRTLQIDLKERADDPTTTWGGTLQREHAEALGRERTGLSWGAWRDNEVDQAAVAWIVATTFVRFCEDNDLLVGATLDGIPVPVGWIAGPGDRILRARENQTAYFRVNTSHHDRDWLQQSFRVLAAQPAGVSLVDPQHNPVWTAEVSAEAAKGLVDFWRRTYDDGALVHDFTDPDLDTRFLGDLYQDLSDHAKKTYALLQTPVFVEEFILDRTLTPAMVEFGVDGLKLIDPTCGSGHFLLGAFERLNQQWATEAPGLDRKQRVHKAMEAIHGVDLNPFAVAIARFRLTVAGILAAGEKSLVGVPEWGFHLAIGDSLLGEQGVTEALFGEETYTYATEDLDKYHDILRPGQYHVVVGNPPYISVKDPVLNEAYRKAYRTTHRQYQLTVPFMELFFRLAIKGASGLGAGYVGKITSNGFMKQEFGKKLIEDFFGGYHTDNPVDVLGIYDTSRAHIPGHATPTVILVGRRRRPVSQSVRVVVAVRGEPGKPDDPSRGLAWSEVRDHADDIEYSGDYVTVTSLDRSALGRHPWPLGSPEIERVLEVMKTGTRLHDVAKVFGYSGQTNSDGAFLGARRDFVRRGVEEDWFRPFVAGEDVRDYRIANGDYALFPYSIETGKLLDIRETIGALKWMWPLRAQTWARATFSKRSYRDEGRTWWEWHQIAIDRAKCTFTLTYPNVATHNHFSLDRDHRLFNPHAPFVQLPHNATEREYLGLLGVLNSSLACFWLKQKNHNKGNGGIGGGIGDEDWEPRYEFAGAKLKDFPLVKELPYSMGETLDRLASDLEDASPAATINAWLIGDRPEGLKRALSEAELLWNRISERLIFEQEELDWLMYASYGVTEECLTYEGGAWDRLQLGERAFEISLAKRVERGIEESTWFERHGSTHTSTPPDSWPEDYRDLVRRRVESIENEPGLALLERPEHKRRWLRTSWQTQLRTALHRSLLDRLEDPELWRDFQGPVTRSVTQLGDLLRQDEVLLEVARVLTRNVEPDVASVIGTVALTEAVPYLAAHRYKPSGLEIYREWQRVWELQRLEDEGQIVRIALPRKYSSKDFQRVEYWKVRGKLDVPKERFVLYPGVGREGDNSLVLGWAGWSHRDQAVALVREIMNQQALGASNEALVPMVAGLVELEPWLHQWHTELEPEFGSSAAQAVTSQIDQFLAQLQMTRDDVNAWRPPAAARGRRRSA